MKIRDWLPNVSAAPEPRPYVAYKPLPGVMPAATMAMDDACAAQIGSIYDNLNGNASAYGLLGGLAWMGYPLLSELAQQPEFRRMAEIIAKEMTRRWIKVSATNDEAAGDDKRALVKIVDDALEHFNVRDRFREMAECDGLFGRGHLYVDTGHTDDLAELQTPLVADRRKLPKGGLKGFRRVEPMWTYPTTYNATDPLDPTFYAPQHWYVNGKRVHSSRLMTFVGREVPDILKPSYAFGGLSLTQMAKPYVDNWLRTQRSVSDLIATFSMSGIMTDLENVLYGGATEELIKRVALFNHTRANNGTMVLNKESEQFFNVSTPLGTLDHLQAQAQEHMASVAGIPLVKLLGITPSGLNASSDGEIRCFYDWIHAQQEHLFGRPLKRIIDLIQMNATGRVDPAIKFSFVPLWQLDEGAMAAVRKTNADTAAVYATISVISPQEERKRLAAEEDGLYSGVDPNDTPDPPIEDPGPDGQPPDPSERIGGGEIPSSEAIEA